MSSCDNGITDNPSAGDQPFQHQPISENFDDGDKPSYETMTFDHEGDLNSYKLMLPWNYDKDYNSDRLYPLMINVHYSGGSNTTLSEAIAGRTSVWYHVGLEDVYDFGYDKVLLSQDPEDQRRNSNKAYNYVKSLNSNAKAVESVETAIISGYQCTITTLTLAGVEIFKRSHYQGMGHGSGPAYNDPEVVKWLFNQNLENRN